MLTQQLNSVYCRARFFGGGCGGAQPAQYVIVCCSVLQGFSVLRCVAMCCNVLQCVAIHSSMFQYVAVCCRVLRVLQCVVLQSRLWVASCYIPAGKVSFEIAVCQCVCVCVRVRVCVCARVWVCWFSWQSKGMLSRWEFCTFSSVFAFVYVFK